MTETQDSICQWAEETFGPVTTTARVVVRANEEMAELLRCLTTGDEAKAAEECADVVIVLCRAAKRLGGQLDFTPDEDCDYSNMTPLQMSVYACHDLADALIGIIWDSHVSSLLLDLRGVIEKLAAVCLKSGTTLEDAIDAKMKINRSRVWKKDGTGHGYHVPQK